MGFAMRIAQFLLLVTGWFTAVLAAPRKLIDSEGRVTALVFAPDDATTLALSAGGPEASAAAFLSIYAERLGLSDPASQLQAQPAEVDKLGHTHLRWQQVHEGVPVRTGELALHLDPAGRPTLATAKIVPHVTGTSEPGIDAVDISILAEGEWWKEFGPQSTPEIREPELAWVDGHALPELKGPPRLAWWVPVMDYLGLHEARTVVLDAQTGARLGLVSSKRDLERRVYNCSNTSTWNCPSELWNGTYQYWFGRRETAPVRGPNPATPYGAQPNGSNLYVNATDTDILHGLFGEVHDYWSSPTTFDRNGANLLGGAGDGLRQPSSRTAGYVLTDHLWPSSCPDNATYYAAWGEFDFCEGSATRRDMVGHEYFHAVAWFEFDPHGTEYAGEVGALEESGADVFGEGFERHVTGSTDWHLFPQANGGVGIRHLANPPLITDWWNHTPFPDRSGSVYMYCGTEDHGGVHHNSTVPSKALYLMSEGGSFNGCEIPAIGFETAQQILYRAWTTYFTRTTTFNEAVIALQMACQDLYGATHPEYLASVTAALQAVEMDQPGFCSGIPAVAPACATRGAGQAWTGLANGDADSLFTDSENVWLHSLNGVPGRRVLVHRLPVDLTPDTWAAIESGGDSLSVTVGMNGTLAANLGALPEGDWHLVVDGDRDSFFQPWSDQLLHVTVSQAPPQVTGLSARTVSQDGTVDRTQLNWNRLPGATPSTLYHVEGDTLPQFTLPQLLVATPDTTWTDSLSVTTMPLRVYRVKAVTP